MRATNSTDGSADDTSHRTWGSDPADAVMPRTIAGGHERPACPAPLDSAGPMRADRQPHVASLHLRSIYRGAARLYRLEPRRVAGASLLILFPAVLISAGIHAIHASATEALGANDPVVLLSVLPALSGFVAILGLVLLGGVMDELVGAGSAERRCPR